MPEILEYEAPPPTTRSYTREAVVFFMGAAAGAVLWLVLPPLTGVREAWDSSYYYLGLFVGGFVAACFAPSRFWVAPIGIYFGQAMYVIVGLITGALAPDPLWLLGAGVALALCTVALLGAAIPALTSHALRRLRGR